MYIIFPLVLVKIMKLITQMLYKQAKGLSY